MVAACAMSAAIVALVTACPRRDEAPKEQRAAEGGAVAAEPAPSASTEPPRGPSVTDAAVAAAAKQTASIAVIPRAAWGANAALTERMHPNTPIRHVTIHHTADKNRAGARSADVLRSIQSFHVGSKKWGDVAYHYFIDPAGLVYEGRDPRYAADTATDYEPRGHVTVCVLGNFEVETPTPALARSSGRRRSRCGSANLEIVSSLTISRSLVFPAIPSAQFT
jgi:hypothetical protein